MPAFVYVLECEARATGEIEFYLNNMPLVRRGDTAGSFAAEQVNEFLVNGENRLAMLINPPSTPPLPAPCHSRLRLVRYPLGASRRWTGRRRAGPAHLGVPHRPHRSYGHPLRCSGSPSSRGDALPAMGRGRVPVSLLYPAPWAWQHAQTVTYSAALRDELFQFLAPIHAALHAGDPEPLIRASLTRLRELGDAYATFNPVERIGLIRKMTARQRRRSWWGMQPIAVDHFEPRVSADGRLVECLASDRLPLPAKIATPKAVRRTTPCSSAAWRTSGRSSDRDSAFDPTGWRGHHGRSSRKPPRNSLIQSEARFSAANFSYPC